MTRTTRHAPEDTNGAAAGETGPPASPPTRSGRNVARFCVENPSIAWVLLVLTVAWGAYGYWNMPKRKDPVIPIPTVAVVCAWPGIGAEEIEDRITKRIEAKLAENPNVERLESIVRTSVTISLVKIADNVKDSARVFDDLKVKLDSVTDLPQGAGPIVFHKDFGDTATLMLTVASPRVAGIELELRARSVRAAIERVRAASSPGAERAALVMGSAQSAFAAGLDETMASLADWLASAGLATDGRPFAGAGFVGLDLTTRDTDEALLAAVDRFGRERLRQPGLHPELWPPIVVRDLRQLDARLEAAAGPRYSRRELDQHTELLQRLLLASPWVGKVTRTGVLPEAVYLGFSPERLAQHGVAPSSVRDALVGRNISLPGGIIEAQGRSVVLSPSGKLGRQDDLGDVMIGGSTRGAPVRLGDLFEITRDYQSPPRFLATFSAPNDSGRWQRTPAITLAIHMRIGGQIAAFGAEVDRVIAAARPLLPADLVVARTSDQPLQVKESISLFTRSLWEAIILVVVVAFIGFRQWRSALLIAASVPLTLAMTFGMMHALGIDLQQTSIASLILALGLLVDDPVVAGDAIQREVDRGHPPHVAAWLGPTKLANAIVFATITNIVAYLPLLLAVDGSVGHFIYSLPVVITCSLVASRVVSMTFVPLLGTLLLRARARRESPAAPDQAAPTTPQSSAAFRPGAGGSESPSRVSTTYRRAIGWALRRRRAVLAAALLSLVASFVLLRGGKTSFFPKDLSYLFYVDVWTPEDAALSATADAARRVEEIVHGVAEAYGRARPGARGEREVLRSITTFAGGSGPRFWFSLAPELQQLNYAQVVVQAADKNDTRELTIALQRALDERLTGARADVRQLETGKPVGVPIALRLAGLEGDRLRQLAERLKGILRQLPAAERVRDDWGAEILSIPLRIDPARANLSGITNLDVALSSLVATNGRALTTLREGEREIPVLLRARPDRRAGLDELADLHVFSAGGERGLPLRQVASLGLELRSEKIRRRNHFRTITVGAFPAAGHYPSEVLAQARPALDAFERELPPGYRLEVGGEKEAQSKGFVQVAIAMLASILLIYLALVFELRSAIKPLVVFSAIPFGIAGALASLFIGGAPFGFMAFLGVASLIGVIVSHIIVLFDFIEEAHARGAPLAEALIDAAIVRLRPVLITAGATVLGLVPLASHGGPLWEPLCFAQIGGLTVATLITLVIVPLIYSVFVLDLRIIRWEGGPK